MNKIKTYITVLMILMLLTACTADNSKVTWEISEIDGSTYINFSNGNKVEQEPGGMISAEIHFDSVKELYDTLKNQTYTPELIGEMCSKFSKNENGLQIINHSDIYIPNISGWEVYNGVDWLGSRCTFELRPTDGDTDNTDFGLAMVCNEEFFDGRYQARYVNWLENLTVNYVNNIKRGEYDAQSYDISTSTGLSLKIVRYVIESNGKTIYVQEEYGSEEITGIQSVNIYADLGDKYLTLILCFEEINTENIVPLIESIDLLPYDPNLVTE